MEEDMDCISFGSIEVDWWIQPILDKKIKVKSICDEEIILKNRGNFFPIINPILHALGPIKPYIL